MKLWTRIALLNVLIVSILGCLIGIAIINLVSTSLRSELNRQGESIAKNLSDRIGNSVLLEEFYGAKNAIEDVLKTEKDVEYVFVTGKKGQLFAHTFQNGFPPDVLTWNPLHDNSLSVQRLNTEKGLMRDIGVIIFDGMAPELHVGIKEERIIQVLNSIKNIILVLTGVFILIGSILSAFLSRLTTRPLYKLVDFSRILSKGEFGGKVEISSTDEVGKLAETFNHLSYELKSYREKMEESYKQMLKTEKLSAIGTLSAGFAHELRNPLTSIKVLFQTFNKDLDITPEDVRVVLSQVNQMDTLLNRFLGFAKKYEFNRSELDVNSLIEQIVSLVDYQLRSQRIKPFLKLQELPPIKADRTMIEQALLNLVLNSIDSMPSGGTLKLSSTREEGFVILTVADSGSGIPEEIQGRVFDPFFTTKSEGTGLGLSIVHNIVEIHHGKIEFSSNHAGTVFNLKLPV